LFVGCTKTRGRGTMKSQRTVAIPRSSLTVARDKSEGGGIHAIPQSRRVRAVREHVAQMRLAQRAFYFRAHRTVAKVSCLADIFLGDGCPDSLATGAQKLGQPVPESNFVLESKSALSQSIQR